jgi:protein-disulfide isomerase
MQSERVKGQVQDDVQLAQRVGVRGTPTIFVNGKIVQNRSLDGFKELIDAILKDAPAAKAAGRGEGS